MKAINIGFTTDIEKRMPRTGEVFCVDRMTSDYAERHPLDVDGFIEGVHQEFLGTEFEESRATLRSLWVAVMSVTSQSGDASLYPNKNGAKRAAAMKVWLKAGDYWRRGFHIGDTLPAILPMTTITRLEDGGWIALFPKDAHLLMDNENLTARREAALDTSRKENDSADNADSTDSADIAPCAERLCREDVRQLDLFAEEEPSAGQNLLKAAGYLAAASVALLVVWQTGLIIPLGLIGLAASGIIK